MDDINNWPEHFILDMLMNFTNDELEAFCAEPVTKKVVKACNDKNVQERIEAIYANPQKHIEKAIQGEQGIVFHPTLHSHGNFMLGAMATTVLIPGESVQPEREAEHYKESLLYFAMTLPFSKFEEFLGMAKLQFPTFKTLGDADRSFYLDFCNRYFGNIATKIEIIAFCYLFSDIGDFRNFILFQLR